MSSGVETSLRDDECIRFLQWALPNLRMQWQGFRKVRRQVCKRVAGRLLDLGLRDTFAYRTYIEAHTEEWKRLDEFVEFRYPGSTGTRTYLNTWRIARSRCGAELLKKPRLDSGCGAPDAERARSLTPWRCCGVSRYTDSFQAWRCSWWPPMRTLGS